MRATGKVRPAFADFEVAFFLDAPRPPLTILSVSGWKEARKECAFEQAFSCAGSSGRRIEKFTHHQQSCRRATRS